VQVDADGGGIPVEVAENEAGYRHVQEVGAVKGPWTGNALGQSTGADDVSRPRSQRSGSDDDFMAIVHWRTPGLPGGTAPPMMTSLEL
jgi:hypothetical protein